VPVLGLKHHEKDKRGYEGVQKLSKRNEQIFCVKTRRRTRGLEEMTFGENISSGKKFVLGDQQQNTIKKGTKR